MKANVINISATESVMIIQCYECGESICVPKKDKRIRKLRYCPYCKEEIDYELK